MCVIMNSSFFKFSSFFSPRSVLRKRPCLGGVVCLYAAAALLQYQVVCQKDIQIFSQVLFCSVPPWCLFDHRTSAGDFYSLWEHVFSIRRTRWTRAKCIDHCFSFIKVWLCFALEPRFLVLFGLDSSLCSGFQSSIWHLFSAKQNCECRL